MAKGKIIVMRLFGGLGNQLFQYAFLFALSRQGGKARLEASSYEHDDKRVCELHHFRVSLPIEGGPPPWAFRKSRIPACLRSLFAAPKYPHFREEKRHGFNPGLAAPPRRHTYFKGYFQTEQYFLHCREQLCREFRLKTPLTPENARILEDIRSCCSISLHIRRTDYLSNPYLSPPPLEYYLRSMAEMEGRLRAAGAPQESLRYFIFSDDIEWARKNHGGFLTPPEPWGSSTGSCTPFSGGRKQRNFPRSGRNWMRFPRGWPRYSGAISAASNGNCSSPGTIFSGNAGTKSGG